MPWEKHEHPEVTCWEDISATRRRLGGSAESHVSVDTHLDLPPMPRVLIFPERFYTREERGVTWIPGPQKSVKERWLFGQCCVT